MEIVVFGISIQLAPLLSSIGLSLDIVGAIIIFRFGLPQNIDRSGKIYRIISDVDESEKMKARFYDRMSFFGIFLLVIGFLLQGLGNWL